MFSNSKSSSIFGLETYQRAFFTQTEGGFYTMKSKKIIRLTAVCFMVCLLVVSVCTTAFAFTEASDDFVWHGSNVSFQANYSSYSRVEALGVNVPSGQGDQAAVLLFTNKADGSTYHLTMVCDGTWHTVQRPLAVGSYTVSLSTYTGTGTPYLYVNFIK